MAITKRGSFEYYGSEDIIGLGGIGNDRQTSGTGFTTRIFNSNFTEEALELTLLQMTLQASLQVSQ
jgi:hypothetical protein